MDKETLITYIQTERARGVLDTDIKTELLTKGWNEAMVAEGLNGSSGLNTAVLPPVMELVSLSLGELWKNIWKSFLIMLLPFASTFVLGFMGGVGMMIANSKIGMVGAGLLAVSVFLLMVLATLISTVMLIKQVEGNWLLTYGQSFNESLRYILPLFIVVLLSTLTILGGIMLFVIPGIIATLWLSFAQILTIVENKRGMSALVSSKELVRGKLGTILTYFAVVFLLVLFVSFIAGLLPVIGVFVSFFTTPFMLIFTIRFYHALKKQQLGKTDEAESKKIIYILLGVAGLTVVAVISLLLLGILILPAL